MYTVTHGIVLRETNYRETDKILTVLTSSEGKITVSARGARRKGSNLSAASQLLAYSEMTLFCYKGRWYLNEAVTSEIFRGLSDDIELLALGSYFAQVTESITSEGIPEPELMQLLLNSLYALSALKLLPMQVKAVFELRVMCLAGFEPMLKRCALCGKETIESPQFVLNAGKIYCGNCLARGGENSISLCKASLEAARYIVYGDAKKLFSFSLPETSLRKLANATEAFMLTQLEREFSTLDFFRQIKLPEITEITNGSI